MRSLLVLGALLALFAITHSHQSEKKKKFIIVVKDNENQNISTTTEAVTTENPEISVLQFKSKKTDFKKKYNITNLKMYKFEAKDGRMIFQREINEKLVPETQTEKYEHAEQTETPVANLYYPLMLYKLCPVPYPLDYLPQDYPDQIIETNDNRRAKQYVPSSVTSAVPSNYATGYYQYYEQASPNLPNHQIYQQYVKPSYVDSNLKYNTVYYTDYFKGIDQSQDITYIPEYISNNRHLKNNFHRNYQITVGHKYTDISPNNQQTVTTSDIYNVKYQKDLNPKSVLTQSPVHSLNVSPNQKEQIKDRFVQSSANDDLYYAYVNNDEELKVMFENLKRNGVKQRNIKIMDQ